MHLCARTSSMNLFIFIYSALIPAFQIELSSLNLETSYFPITFHGALLQDTESHAGPSCTLPNASSS